MLNWRLRQGLHAAAYLLATFAITVLTSTSLVAQQEIADPHDPANQQRLNNQDMHEREVGLRTRARVTTEGPVTGRDPKLMLSQINEDYTRIQVLNNELRRAGAVKDALDYKRISATSAEIKKRAARLKNNLAFPEPAEERKESAKEVVAFDAAQLKTSLTTLDNLIMSFVENPVFQASVQKVDVKLAAKASQDLNSIIELCANLKKSVEKLNKEQAKSDNQ